MGKEALAQGSDGLFNPAPEMVECAGALFLGLLGPAFKPVFRPLHVTGEGAGTGG